MASKPFEESAVRTPHIVGWVFKRDPSIFVDPLNNTSKIIGPVKILASALIKTNDKKEKGDGRKLIDLTDQLDRKTKSAKKDVPNIRLIRMVSASSVSDFETKVKAHAQYASLVSFQSKLKEISGILGEIKIIAEKYNKKP